jgi:tRNA(adenine34) deaminase
MALALSEARAALDAGEVPVGAIVVIDGEVAGRGYNQPIARRDPTAHAEMLALREAATATGNYRLSGATLFATIEPCAMCAGALVHARVERLVYGAADPRAGAISSVFQLCSSSALNHQVEIAAGVLEEECRDLIQSFFRARRELTS